MKRRRTIRLDDAEDGRGYLSMSAKIARDPSFFTQMKTEGITAFYNKFSRRTLASKKFDVATLVDVGVFKGTSELGSVVQMS